MPIDTFVTNNIITYFKKYGYNQLPLCVAEEGQHVHSSPIALEDVEERHLLEGGGVDQVPHHTRRRRGAHKGLEGSFRAPGKVRLRPHQALPEQAVVLGVASGYFGGMVQRTRFNYEATIQGEGGAWQQCIM